MQTTRTRSRAERRRTAYALTDRIEDELPEVAHAFIHDCQPAHWKCVTIAVELWADSDTYTVYGNPRVGAILSTNLRSLSRRLTSLVAYHADVADARVEERPERVRQSDTTDLYTDNVYLLDVTLK
jgi:hypothetical protein